VNLDLITPYLRPLTAYVNDVEVSEIAVNAGGSVWVERFGQLERAHGITISESHLQAAVRNIARLLGDDISQEMPLLDARLKDGSRVAAAMPPASVGGTVLNIRKFRQGLTPGELVRRGMLTQGQHDLLERSVKDKRTILISGATGTGKTTLLNALASFLPPNERVILIEDTSEIDIAVDNLVRFEARRAQENKPAVTVRSLLQHSLRHRPDRLVLGEVRGAEAFDLLTLMNTGHEGTLSTIHANSAYMSIERMRTCVAMAGQSLPDQVIAKMISESIDLLVHIVRVNGHRIVRSVLRLGKYDSGNDSFSFEEV
jgi:pilus assembly protein CpaF